MSDELYYKNSDGKFVPVSFNKVITDEWDDKIVVVRVGSKDDPATKEDADQLTLELEDLEVLSSVHASFLILDFGVDFEVYGSLEELKEKNVYVWIKGGDDLSKLGDMAKEAKAALKNTFNKVVLLPTPLTVNKYAEINEIRKRLGVIKKRRGR
jgi:hypothetical protein